MPASVIIEVALPSDWQAPLAVAEAKALGTVAPRRQEEFAAGRACARRALARLGVPVEALLRGEGREPVWPSGVIGSITHCAGHCAAAVASSRDSIISIGIDAEPDEPLPPEVVQDVLTCQEVAQARHLGTGNWDRVMFSAKESLFKAWSPISRSWLGFDEAVVTLDPKRASFAVRFEKPEHEALLAPHVLRGRFAVAEGLVHTALAVGGGRASHV